MSRIAKRLDAIREKPHHVRRRVAFATATVITGFIAVVWLGSSLYVGSFALKPMDFSQMAGAEPVTGSPTSGAPVATPNGSATAAAAEAAPIVSGPPGLDIIGQEGGTKGPSPEARGNPNDPASGGTIIPF